MISAKASNVHIVEQLPELGSLMVKIKRRRPTQRDACSLARFKNMAANAKGARACPERGSFLSASRPGALDMWT